jgi:transposase
MIDFSKVYIYSDQPTTCPRCGLRSEIILDLSHTKDITQIHKCPNKKCEFEFIMQYDEEFDNGSLL